MKITHKFISRPDFHIVIEEFNGEGPQRFYVSLFDEEMLQTVYEFETYGGACDQALDLLDAATKMSEARAVALLEQFIDPKTPTIAIRAEAHTRVRAFKKA